MRFSARIPGLGLVACALLASAILLWSTTVTAQIYESRDSQGRRTYSDRPTTGAVRRSDVENTKANSQGAAQAAQSLEELRRAVAMRQELDEAKRREESARRQVAADREQQCRAARERYFVITESRRPFRPGSKGEREYLSAAQIDTARKAAQQAIDSFCGATSNR